ncbi:BMC domain-containing protein [Tissierella sp. MSJ-40]|uniref:BMC domain-containing protein n=1 Tax=Tissierella simiarum TaxID=2841534 RepID=A0ABS6E8H5_9FIRM|nr:BMC domain-containing protein [Tissierella simiarum]
MKNKALGLIETYGYIPAIEAADASAKSANVTIIKMELVKGGLVCIFLTGDVSAVKTAVDAGEVAANMVGRVVSKTVISRPGESLETILNGNKSKEEKIKENTSKGNTKKEKDIQEENSQDKSKDKSTETKEGSVNNLDLDNLGSMKVVELRKIARNLDGLDMDNNEIKVAKKDELITAIGKYSGKEE